MKKVFTILLTSLMVFGSTAKASPKKEVAPKVTFEVEKEVERLPAYAKPHIVFHYFRNDANYNSYAMWIWGQNEEGSEYVFTESDAYGKYLHLPVDNFIDQTQVNFLLKTRGSWAWQTPDINIQYSDFTFDAVANAYHFYLVNGLTTVFPSAEDARANQVTESIFASKNTIQVSTNNEPTAFVVKADAENIASGAAIHTYNNTTWSYVFTANLGVSFSPDFAKAYTIEVSFTDGPAVSSQIGLSGLFDDPYFIDNMTYDGDDLGVTYTPAKTTIKAWAPTASDLKLRIYENGTPVALNADLGNDTYAEHQFVREPTGGVWKVELTGDYHGKYYTFVAKHPTGDVELIDPYAKSAGINGVRGMIVDFSKTNPTGWDDVDYPVKSHTEIIPYELHVADLTADESWTGTEAKRKRFLGLIEEGTTYTKDGVTVKTGFDHIKELGINALQIIPFYDQANDERNPSFNWGYNPHNYDVLEGSYSSNPYDGLVRIREFKQVVKAYAAEDIRIIMDVVYNHVANLGGHSFNKLVPGYYFRYNADGSPTSASGCGNDTASERIMMERFMRDSTAFWVEEYKIGGFRFDLMGLHTVQAMNTVRNRLIEIRPDIFIIGEAWKMGGATVEAMGANQGNIHKVPGVGAFNDKLRDAVKGDTNGRGRGWVQLEESNIGVGIRNNIRNGMLGKITDTQSSPVQTVNYVACHDNLALYDKLVYAGGSDFGGDLNRLAQQNIQAEAISLLSQGVSFIHAGSEILRSKPLGNGQFDHNSYQSPYSVNSLKWNEKVTNLDVFEKYQELIALKRDIAGFQYTTRTDIDANVSVKFGTEIGYANNLIKLVVIDGDDTYTAYFFGAGARLRIDDLEGHMVVFDSSSSYENGAFLGRSVILKSNMTLVTKSGPNVIPPTSEDPGTTSEPITPDNGEDANLIWLYITLPTLAVIGIGTLLFFFLRKKQISPK
ncbi:MAG: type I pullulanase [Bacilli bacterium]|jgi:pullulanase